jgi:hypothetical protein
MNNWKQQIHPLALPETTLFHLSHWIVSVHLVNTSAGEVQWSGQICLASTRCIIWTEYAAELRPTPLVCR